MATVIRDSAGHLMIADSLGGFGTVEEWAGLYGDTAGRHFQFVSRQFEAGCLASEIHNTLEEVISAMRFHNPVNDMDVSSNSQSLNDLHNIVRMRNALRDGQDLPDPNCSYTGDVDHLRSQLQIIAPDALNFFDTFLLNTVTVGHAMELNCSNWRASSS
ncbi:hypothetical protein H0A36_24930 [Endozoicomonas sp. SM1973]|uniref:Uncharacterized protein n=1 Tax=Spartinivicinus marinus TaxID=2994442 RepID=A0A853IFF7_9GAMM|nr:hypothetical protein [Spartinivicinus marinus]